jgi:hypothetical protein
MAQASPFAKYFVARLFVEAASRRFINAAGRRY